MRIYETWSDEPDGTAGNDDLTDYWAIVNDVQYLVLKIDVNGDGTADAVIMNLPSIRPPRLPLQSLSNLDFVED